MLNKVIIGDYHVKFGQGLGLWSGFSAPYSNQVGQLAKADLGLMNSSSATEFGYLSGIAVELKLSPNTFWSSFVSKRHLDATIQMQSEQE